MAVLIAAAAAWKLPAPAPTSPTSGMKLAETAAPSSPAPAVSFGFASSISATAPLTTPADMLVPLSVM